MATRVVPVKTKRLSVNEFIQKKVWAFDGSLRFEEDDPFVVDLEVSPRPSRQSIYTCTLLNVGREDQNVRIQQPHDPVHFTLAVGECHNYIIPSTPTVLPIVA